MALIDNLIAHWRMNENSGNEPDAHSTNTLTLTGTVSPRTGKLNGARGAYPTDNTNYFLNTNVLSVNQNVSHSFSFWLYLTGNPGSEETIISNGGPASADWQIRINVNASRQIVARVAKNWISFQATLTSSALSTVTWHHIVITYNGSNREFKLYVNNGAPYTATATSTTYNSASAFMIGGYYYNGGGFTKAGSATTSYVDSVSYWNRVIDATDVDSLFVEGNGIDYPFSTGYGNKVNGINPGKINSISTSNISKVNGV